MVGVESIIKLFLHCGSEEKKFGLNTLGGSVTEKALGSGLHLENLLWGFFEIIGKLFFEIVGYLGVQKIAGGFAAFSLYYIDQVFCNNFYIDCQEPP